MLERESVSRKELTGFSENNCPLVEPRDRDSARFSTHYQQRYTLKYIHSIIIIWLGTYNKVALPFSWLILIGVLPEQALG